MNSLKKIAFLLSLVYTVYYIANGIFNEFILSTAGYARFGTMLLKPNAYILMGITILLWYTHIKITKKTTLILISSLLSLLISYIAYPHIFFSKKERDFQKQEKYFTEYIKSLGTKEDIRALLDKTEQDFSDDIENQIESGYYQETKIKKNYLITSSTPFYIDDLKFVRISPEKIQTSDIKIESNFLNAAIEEFGCTIDESIVNDRDKYMEVVNNCINEYKNFEVFKEDQALLLFEMTYDIFNTFGNKNDDEYPFYK